MADVSVEVAGRAYRLACEDGEEGHLRALAGELDAEARRLLGSLRSAPEEARLMLMLALLMADRRAEAAGGLAEREARIGELEQAVAEAEQGHEGARAALLEAGERVAALEAEQAELRREAERLERALAAATEAAESREAAGTREAAAAPADLFAGQDGAERARRITRLAERLENLTEQITYHMGED
jgi:cell division protein ZapA